MIYCVYPVRLNNCKFRRRYRCSPSAIVLLVDLYDTLSIQLFEKELRASKDPLLNEKECTAATAIRSIMIDKKLVILEHFNSDRKGILLLLNKAQNFAEYF